MRSLRPSRVAEADVAVHLGAGAWMTGRRCLVERWRERKARVPMWLVVRWDDARLELAARPRRGGRVLTQ